MKFSLLCLTGLRAGSSRGTNEGEGSLLPSFLSYFLSPLRACSQTNVSLAQVAQHLVISTGCFQEDRKVPGQRSKTRKQTRITVLCRSGSLVFVCVISDPNHCIR